MAGTLGGQRGEAGPACRSTRAGMHFLTRHDPLQIPDFSNRVLGQEQSGTYRVPACRLGPGVVVSLRSIDGRMDSDASLHNPEAPGHALDCSCCLEEPSFFSRLRDEIFCLYPLCGSFWTRRIPCHSPPQPQQPWGRSWTGPSMDSGSFQASPCRQTRRATAGTPPVPEESPRGSEKPYMLLVQCPWCTRSHVSSESLMGPRQDSCLPKAGLRGHLQTAPSPGCTCAGRCKCGPRAAPASRGSR